MSGLRALPMLLVALALAACGPVSASSAEPSRSAAPPTERAAIAVTAAPTVAAPSPTDLPPTTAPPTATPQPALLPLTEPGCCMQPYWSADGRTVLFIDQPGPTEPLGVYGVSVEGGPVELVTEQIGKPGPSGRYLTYLDEAAQVVVEDLQTGEVWQIPSDKHEVHFSPSGERLAWDEVTEVGAFSKRPATISVSNVDGTDARVITTVYGGGLASWLDDEHLLLSGTQEGTGDEALFTLNINSGERVTLAESERLRGGQVAPGGEWVYYAVALDSQNPEKNGQWVIRADGSQQQELALTGGVHWRDATRLLIVPLEMGAPSHRLVQFDIETGEYTDLTDPAETPFRILGGEWKVSPTGEHVVFVSAEDEALWLLRLP